MDPSLMKQINPIQLQIIRYEEPIILILGNLGNIINILVFRRNELRRNVCSWYFICLSLSHILLLDVFCISRIIITSTGNNVFQYITSLCKFRAYIFELSLLLARYFLCLISIDRWMITSSNVRVREYSSPRISRWLILIGSIIIIIFSFHAAIGYAPGPVECTPPFGSKYELFLSIESLITSFTPMFIMSLFSLLTVLNVRSRINRRIHTQTAITQASNPVDTQRRRNTLSNKPCSRQLFKRNIQLVRLSIVQVLFYVLLNSIWSIVPIYSFSVGSQAMMTINHQMMVLFLGRIGLNLIFTYTALTFILYTVASKAFRTECITAFKQWLTRIQQRF